MSEQAPHNDSAEQQFNDLPLPDENGAWEKMKKLLDEEEERKPLLPLYFRSCMGWMVVVALISALWFFARPDRWWQPAKETAKKEYPPTPAATQPATGDPGAGHRPPAAVEGPGETKPRLTSSASSARKDSMVETDGPQLSGRPGKEKTTGLPLPSNEKPVPRIKVSGAPANNRAGVVSKLQPPTAGIFPTRNRQVKQTGTDKKDRSVKESRNPAAPSAREKTPTGRPPGRKEIPLRQASGELPHDTTVKPGREIRLVPAPVDSTKTGSTTDTLSHKIIDSTLEKKPEDPAKPPRKKPAYYYAAGLSVQQQVPLAGQKAVPYNYYGRKGSLADYLPSVYARFYKEDEWFVQAEFRYGAPQSVKEFSYSSRASTDTFGSWQTTRIQRLKKTFYHQVPVSFNYLVLSNLSLGAGFMYSRFHGAVTELEIKRENLQSGIVQTLSKEIVHIDQAADSFFTRSQLHLSAETQYAWKRLSLGLRYTFGLQPYIRYTDNTGALKQEKNRNLNVFLRFQVWRSGKK